MKYIVEENVILNDAEKRNATSKARSDVLKVCCEENYVPLEISTKLWSDTSGLKKLLKQLKTFFIWMKAFSRAKKNDTVVVQWPPMSGSYSTSLAMWLSSRKLKIVLLIHDVPSLLWMPMKGNAKRKLNEEIAFNSATKIILHNNSMKKEIVRRGIDSEKCVVLELFDYLMPNKLKNVSRESSNAVVIAGNLRKEKAAYLYKMPESININLYGVGYEGTCDNINYNGSFLPEELPDIIDGKFGLIWDGESTETCTGWTGNYLRYNNPHKTSLYLSAGMPVITWTQAAIAEFVKKESCGVLVDSLIDITSIMAEISEDKYQIMEQNARKIGEHVREGYYIRKALQTLECDI